MECANVRYGRHGGGRLNPPRRCITSRKRYTPMRSNRPRAAASARKSHAHALHAHSNFCCTHGMRQRAICGGAFGCCLRAASALAWVLLGCCLGAASVRL
eukprot:1882546-Lingulodinium_polyedra.AAC.1